MPSKRPSLSRERVSQLRVLADYHYEIGKFDRGLADQDTPESRVYRTQLIYRLRLREK